MKITIDFNYPDCSKTFGPSYMVEFLTEKRVIRKRLSFQEAINAISEYSVNETLPRWCDSDDNANANGLADFKKKLEE